MGKFRVGVIGCGGIAGTHLRAYRSNGVDVAAVADVDFARAQARAVECGAKAYADYVEMIDKEGLDAISICTPPAMHRDAALAAFALGIPVLCEKPIARTVAEAREMVSAAAEAKTLLMTGFCHRYHGGINRLKELMSNGAIGQPVAFRNRFATRIRNLESTWFVKPEISGGGVLLDNGVHSVDLFRYLCGEVVSSSARLRTILPGLVVEDTAAMVLAGESGIVGTIELSWATPGSDNVVAIYGTEGQAMVDYNAGELRYRKDGDSDWQIEPDQPPNRFHLEVANFLWCVESGDKPRVEGHDGLRALEIIAEAYASASKAR